MSTRRFWSTALVGSALSLLSSACATEDDGVDVEGYDNMRQIELADDATCVPLYAGQTIEVGTVCVAVDNTVDTSAQCGAGAAGVMNVTYNTTGGWEIIETHLAAGDELGDIPSNRKGNPKIGNFPHASGDITGATTQTHSVALCDLGLDAADTSCDPVKAYLGAHASVRLDNGDGTYQQETAWGDGERMVKKGSWAEYFNMHLTCSDTPAPPPPEPAECETAFALAGNGDETCFIGADFDGDGIDDGINRWGWSNAVDAGTTDAVWPVYAAAGQCQTGNGELIGYLSVSYADADADGQGDGSATVTFNRTGSFTLDEEHLYIGTEPLARDTNGDYTVAPGQYPIVVDLEDATTTSHTVSGLTAGTIYVVYHGVACGDFGGDGGGDPGGGDDGGAGDDGGTPICEDALADNNDDFDTDLSGWNIHRPQDASTVVTGGELVIEPVDGSSWWFGNSEAVHVHKPISGNFAMTTFVAVTDLQGASTLGGSPYRVGGIMIRDPQAPAINSVHVAYGNMNNGTCEAVSKSTVDSQSDVHTVAYGDGIHAELKICRVGNHVETLVRDTSTGTWSSIMQFQRDFLPTELVAGPIAYVNPNAPADLRTAVDYVRFETVESMADCTKDYDPVCL